MIAMQRRERVIEVPEGVTVSIEGKRVTVFGPKGSLERNFSSVPGITIELDGNRVVVKPVKMRRKFKANAGTVAAHISNMIKGVQGEWVYTLRVVYTHFPIKVEVKGDTVVINNLRGAKTPVYARILPGARVEVKGKEIEVRSIDKEAAGQTAANIEQATKLPPSFDPRKFQDGIYIVEKARWVG